VTWLDLSFQSTFIPCLVSLQYTALCQTLYQSTHLRSSHPVSSLLSVFLIQIACLHVNSSPAQRIHFSQCQLSHHHHCTSHHPLTIIWFPLFPHHSAFNKHCVHLNLSVSSCVCDRCIKSDWTWWTIRQAQLWQAAVRMANLTIKDSQVDRSSCWHTNNIQ